MQLFTNVQEPNWENKVLLLVEAWAVMSGQMERQVSADIWPTQTSVCRVVSVGSGYNVATATQMAAQGPTAPTCHQFRENGSRRKETWKLPWNRISFLQEIKENYANWRCKCVNDNRLHLSCSVFANVPNMFRTH
jgi:hypothetical protein